jgi:hypothetical protein
MNKIKIVGTEKNRFAKLVQSGQKNDAAELANGFLRRANQWRKRANPALENRFDWRQFATAAS